MSYEERRKNNTYLLKYDNQLGDHDLFFYDPNENQFYVSRDKDRLYNGDMLLGIEQEELPQIVRKYFDSRFREINVLLGD